MAPSAVLTRKSNEYIVTLTNGKSLSLRRSHRSQIDQHLRRLPLFAYRDTKSVLVHVPRLTSGTHGCHPRFTDRPRG